WICVESTRTSAPGIGAPPFSVTLPAIVPVCAHAAPAHSSAAHTTAKRVPAAFVMSVPRVGRSLDRGRASTGMPARRLGGAYRGVKTSVMVPRAHAHAASTRVGTAWEGDAMEAGRRPARKAGWAGFIAVAIVLAGCAGGIAPPILLTTP